MKRIAAVALLSLGLSMPAYAADTATNGAADAATTDATAAVPPLTFPALTPAQWVAAHQRPALLPALYASFAGLQIFDVVSTHRALAAGGQEANPMMKSVVGNPAVFWSVKAAATVGPMLAAERLWKTNKVAAIAVMAASNGVMAMVAAHNASVLRSQR